MHSKSERTSHSSLLRSQLNPEVLNILADKLQAVARSLLTLTRELEPPTSDSIPNNNSNETSEPDQIPRFLVPGSIGEQELENLRQHRAENLVEFLKMDRDDLTLTSIFMRGFHDDLEIDGPTVQHIGVSLARPLNMLSQACALFTDFELQSTASERPSDY